MELFQVNQYGKGYGLRTRLNAESADLTLAFAMDMNTAGERLTKSCSKKYLGFEIDQDTDPQSIVHKVYGYRLRHNVSCINIAGNGLYTLSKYGCSQLAINLFVYTVVSRLHNSSLISKIVTGGQTGVDTAGAVAGILLEIPTVVTMPLGYLQRDCSGVDYRQTVDDAKDYFLTQAQRLRQRLMV